MPARPGTIARLKWESKAPGVVGITPGLVLGEKPWPGVELCEILTERERVAVVPLIGKLPSTLPVVQMGLTST